MTAPAADAASAQGATRGLWARAVLGLAGALAVAVAFWRLFGFEAGLAVETHRLGTTPVSVYRAEGAPPGPAVVIAHGFAGSRQLMKPFATSLARAGYTAVSFDFAGHGRNGAPMRGDLDRIEGVTRQLVAEIAAVTAFARAHAGADGRVALLGHSMASDLVIRAGIADPDIAATIAVSMFSPAVEGVRPANLLAVAGALEPRLREEGLRALSLAGVDDPQEGVTYGSVAEGTARRAAAAGGVEHVGVLYSRQSLTEARDWLDAVFDRRSNAALSLYGPWIGLWVLGLALLAWPLSRLAPGVADPATGGGMAWRPFLLTALPPAALTPLLLWPLPIGFLPILVGDYLAVHFALYGVLTAVLMRAVGAPEPRLGGPLVALLLATAGAVLAYWLLIRLPIDRFITSFAISDARAPLALAVFLGALPFFLADEWATRGPGARWGAYAATKLLFLISLGVAVALSFERLFFLIMILPVILLFFLLFGLFSGLMYRATGSPWPAALANAAAFAFAIAAVFPLFQS